MIIILSKIMSFLNEHFLRSQTGATHLFIPFLIILLIIVGFVYNKQNSILGTQTPTLGQLLRVDKIPSSSSDYIYTYVMKTDKSGHVYIYWTENAEYPTEDRALFRVSNDFGQTFTSDSIIIPTPPNTQLLSAGSVLKPQMCSDNTGHIYLLREYRPNSWSKDPVKVYINLSSDNGKTWLSRDITLSHWNQASNEIVAQHTTSPQISCDESGYVYVVWSDERDGTSNLFFNYSSDFGKNWLSQEIKINQGINPTSGWTLPQISSDNSGHIYITWQSFRGSKVDIYFSRSEDFGKTWAEPVRVDRAPEGTQLFTPAISSDENGNVYIGWRDRRASISTNQIYLNRSRDFGRSWQANDQRIDNDPSISNSINQLTPMPLLSSNNFGYVFALWEETAYSSLKPHLNYSKDSGVSWQSQDNNIDNHTTSNQSIRESSLSADNLGHVYSTFEFNRDMWLNYSADNGASWLPVSIQLDSQLAQGTEQYGYPYQANPYLVHDDNGHIYVLFGDYHYQGYGKLPAYLYLMPITVQTTFTPLPTPTPSPSPTTSPTSQPSPTSSPTPPPVSCDLPCHGRSHKDPPKTDGTGWVKININANKAVYVPKLPKDPLENDVNHYIYCADIDGWELAVKLESEKFKDLMKNDGGDDDNMYELGSNLRLVNVRRGCEY